MFENYPDIVGILELKKMLGIGETKARELIKSGEIPCFQVGRKKRIPKLSIIKFVNKNLQNEEIMVKYIQSNNQAAES